MSDKNIEKTNIHIKLNGIIILNLSLKKKVKTSPNKYNINGILFPENKMPIPKMHITITTVFPSIITVWAFLRQWISIVTVRK